MVNKTATRALGVSKIPARPPETRPARLLSAPSLDRRYCSALARHSETKSGPESNGTKQLASRLRQPVLASAFSSCAACALAAGDADGWDRAYLSIDCATGADGIGVATATASGAIGASAACSDVTFGL